MNHKILFRTIVPVALALSACQPAPTETIEPTSETKLGELVSVPEGVEFLDVRIDTHFGNTLLRGVPVSVTVICSADNGGVVSEVTLYARSTPEGEAVVPNIWLACGKDPSVGIDVDILWDPLTTPDGTEICAEPIETERITKGIRMESQWDAAFGFCENDAFSPHGIERGN